MRSGRPATWHWIWVPTCDLDGRCAGWLSEVALLYYPQQVQCGFPADLDDEENELFDAPRVSP